MNSDDIQQAFRDAVANSVELFPEGEDRYQVFTPFHFDDGDHFVVVLRKRDGRWQLTDEGNTYMHLSYRMDSAMLASGTRSRVIEGALEKYGVCDEDGVLLVELDEPAAAGKALYNFLQCLTCIANVAYLGRDLVASIFMEDLAFLDDQCEALAAAKKRQRLVSDYHDLHRDPSSGYQGGLTSDMPMLSYLGDAVSSADHLWIEERAYWSPAPLPVGRAIA